MNIAMSRKKLLGLFMVPLAVAVIGSGAAVFASHPANAQASQVEQEAPDKSEPGDTPDKPGQSDAQDQNEYGKQKDTETND